MPTTLQSAFKSKGLPVSRQRLLVVQLLSEATDHPTINQLLMRARLIDPFISRTAVSRALKILVEAKLAYVFETLRGQFRYEDATTGQHDHLVDEATGKMINVWNYDVAVLAQKVAADLGYRLTSHRMTLTGRLDKAQNEPGASQTDKDASRV